MSPAIIVFLIGVLSIVLFATQWVPIGVVGIIVAFLLNAANVETGTKIFANFSSTTVIMFACLYALGFALNKTSLVGRLTKLVHGMKGNERKTLIALSTISIVIAVLTNAGTTTAVMLPIVLILSKQTGVSKSRILKPCVDMASIWTGALPIGMGLTSMAMNNGILSALGSEEVFSPFTYTKVALPIVVVATIYYWFVGYKLMPVTPNDDIASGSDAGNEKKLTELKPWQDIATIAVFFATVAMMVASTFIKGLDAYMVALCGVVLLQVIGVYKGSELISKAINWNVVLLVGGMGAYASALSTSGAADIIGNMVKAIAGEQTSQVVLAFIFFAVPCLMTQVMNNVSTWQFMAALEGACAVSLGLNPVPAVLLANLGAIMAVGLPSAFSGQALIMEPGSYKIIDYVKAFVPLFIIFSIMVCILVPIFCPF